MIRVKVVLGDSPSRLLQLNPSKHKDPEGVAASLAQTLGFPSKGKQFQVWIEDSLLFDPCAIRENDTLTLKEIPIQELFSPPEV